MKNQLSYMKENTKVNIKNKFLNTDSSSDSIYTSIYRVTTTKNYYWSNNTIESGRKVISRLLKKEKKKNNPKCLTLVKHFGLNKTSKKKGRMGKGKGKVIGNVCLLNENSCIYIVRNISIISMKKVMGQLQKKMPVKLKISH